MARIIPSLVTRAWNKVFGGEFDRAVYFAFTIIGGLALAVVSVVLKRVAYNAATEASPVFENVPVAVVLALVVGYWAVQVFQVGFYFWCMVRRLHHAGKTAQAAVWYLVVVAVLLVFAVVEPAPTWGRVLMLVSVGFWIWIGVLKPTSEKLVPTHRLSQR